jgi:hypothetical protein
MNKNFKRMRDFFDKIEGIEYNETTGLPDYDVVMKYYDQIPDGEYLYDPPEEDFVPDEYFATRLERIKTEYLTEGELNLHTPENRYRIHPIMHDLCDNESFKEKLVPVIESGAGGIVTNVTWNSKEWTDDKKNIDILRRATEYVQSLGMHVWLYDDYYYPSGLANGFAVDGQPKNFVKAILFHHFPVVKGEKYKIDLVLNDVIALGIYNEEFDFISRATVKKGHVIAKATGELIIFYSKTFEEPVTRGAMKGHLDFLSLKAVDSFFKYALLPTVRDAYIPFNAVFTDEPSLAAGDVISFRRGKVDFSRFPLPYTNNFKTLMRAYLGGNTTLYDDNKFLFLIAGDTLDAKITRIQYYKFISRLARDRFTDRMTYHINTKMQTLSSGHFLLEEGLKFHVGYYADYMRVVGAQDIPGCDILCAEAGMFFKQGAGFGTAWSYAAKYPSSLSRLKGHNVTMLEICPVNLPKQKMLDNPFKEFMGLSTYAIFAGITHYNAYGYFFIEDKAQHQHLNRYVGRLLTILRNAVPISPVLVYYPIAAMQAAFYTQTPFKEGEIDLSPEAEELENKMERLLNILYEMGTDFNIIDDDHLADAKGRASIKSGIINATTLIIPFTEFISADVLVRINQFRRYGVKVILVDKNPERLDNGMRIMPHNQIRVPVITLDELKDQEGLYAELPFKVTGENIYLSPYSLRGRKLQYVINTTENDTVLTVENGIIYDPDTDEWSESTTYILKGERGLFVFEKETEKDQYKGMFN